MKFDMSKIVAVVVNGATLPVRGETVEPRPKLNGIPQADRTAVALVGGGYAIIRDDRVDALIFSDKEPDALN